MAIVEVQVREDLFLAMLEAELLRVPLPGSLVDSLATLGQSLPGNEPLLVERIECTSLQLVPDAPSAGPAGPGKLLVKVQAAVHLTTRPLAKAAGHLQPPGIALTVTPTLWIRLGLTHQKRIEFAVVESSGLYGYDFEASGSFALGAPAPLDFVAWAVALLARDGVVVVRMGTRSEDLDDEPAFRAAWMGNRLNGAGWGLFTQGEVFGQQLARQLAAVVRPVVAASSNPKLEETQAGSGAWFAAQRLAAASMNLNAIDALPLDFDAPFRIEVATVLKAALVGGGSASLVLDTRIQWIAEDLLSDLGLGVTQSILNDAIAGSLRGPLDGQQETGRGDDFVTFTTTRYLDAPRSRTVTAQVTEALVDESGLVLRGALQVRPRPSAVWSIEKARWHYAGNCHGRSVTLALVPPTVQLVGTDPFVELWELQPPSVSPLLFWEHHEQRSLPGAFPVVLEVEFRPAPWLLGEVGTGDMDACLCTNVGVRWVDLGPVPEKPATDPQEVFWRTAQLVSRCMAISDRWGMGVLNLDWRVDPPDLRVAGDPPLHEWRLSAAQLAEVPSVQLYAVGREGGRRALGTVPVVGGALEVQVVTAADESLELRTGRAMAGRAPQVLHRWIAPWLSIRLEGPVRAFRLEGERLTLVLPDGTQQVMLLEGRTVRLLRRGPATPERAPEQRPTASPSVAVLHQDHLVLGLAGRFEPAEVGALGTRAPPGVQHEEGSGQAPHA